jgi:hypothetical protein
MPDHGSHHPGYLSAVDMQGVRYSNTPESAVGHAEWGPQMRHEGLEHLTGEEGRKTGES